MNTLYFDFWEQELENKNKSTGGYEELVIKVKESVTLQRRARRILGQLNKTFNQTKEGNCWGHNNLVLPSKDDLTRFSLPNIPRCYQYTANGVFPFSSWKLHNDIDQQVVPKELKEKLTVSKQNLEILKELRNDKRPSFNESFCDLLGKQKIMGFYIVPEDQISKKTAAYKTYYKRVSGELMPAKLQHEFDTLMDEELVNIVEFYQDFDETVRMKPFRYQGFSKFILEINIPFHQHKKRNLEFLLWKNSNSPLPEDNTIFKSLESKVFNASFHEFEFYRLPIRGFDRKNSKKRQRFQFRSKQVWRLDKEKLKQINWNPFRALKNLQLCTLLDKDRIKQQYFTLPKAPPFNQYLRCGELDLIDMERKMFTNLTLLVQTPVEQIEEEKNNLDMTVSANDGKETPINVRSSSVEVTQPSINTSRMALKRSFIDDDLRSLLELKRKKRNKKQKTGDDESVNNTTILELLECGTIIQETNVSAEKIERVRTPIVEHSKPKSLCNKFVSAIDLSNKIAILNTTLLKKNLLILQNLVQNGANIVELQLPTPCDFILDSTTCLLRLDIAQFFQKTHHGKLMYQTQISKLLREYHKVIILVEYSKGFEDYDPDIFWKVRLFLENPRCECSFTTSELSAVSYWIQWYITRYSPNTGYNMDDLEETQESKYHEVLSFLSINPFALQDIVNRFTLPEFLFYMSPGNENPFLKGVLTKSQRHRTEQLLSLHW
ncbi:Zip2p KNAG_0I00180 [Huiozyma naganishii CBS 8797]|uniref:Uncharacterized protein n=1 Tax=Huiozyma naganishii (strain ATCC MYA-139 / BCRC 22969 / CBS 8797 / KCTC 17520 / NBRC 10181 / NCYC 3082 / Yp74L-3) TaxID=1071383 RepID=J7S8Y4_HUIN7|nr:hypothetical protein KNAG_0I00180 [Kazachstania naganishii CBS 8797]CCK71809.1 hypothetical protein KNAG_0I00180 [Kazachstania naganishii CBS 8797]